MHCPAPQWTRRVSLTVNSERYAYWPDLSRSHSMFPQKRNHPLRYARFPSRNSRGKARRKLLGGHLQVRQATMASHHLIAQLESGLPPTPQVPSVERTRSPRELFAVTTPYLGCNASGVPTVDKLRKLLPASFCFSPETSSLACSRIGAGACPILAISTELAIDRRSPDLLVQNRLNSGANVFDVAAWLKLVKRRKSNVGSATVNPRDLMAHRLLR